MLKTELCDNPVFMSIFRNLISLPKEENDSKMKVKIKTVLFFILTTFRIFIKRMIV